jgi:hypothetical protein
MEGWVASVGDGPPGGYGGEGKGQEMEELAFPKNRRFSEFEEDKKVGRYTHKIRRERE